MGLIVNKTENFAFLFAHLPTVT